MSANEAGALATPAWAAKVGDVVFLSKSAGLTLTNVRRLDKDVVQLTGVSTAANAAEFCRRYENLTPASNKWKGCGQFPRDRYNELP